MADSPIKFIQARCPSCGAIMNLEDYRTTAFCSYCGSRILIHRENERIYRTIDEAKIEQAKAYKAVELQKAQNNANAQKRNAEIEMKKQETKSKILKYFLIGFLVYLAFVLLVIMFSGIMSTIGRFISSSVRH